jgi:hypothetical protein
MANQLGMIQATPPTAAPAQAATDAAATTTDTSLPDPTRYARWFLGAMFVVAAGVAVILSAAGWTTKPFTPSSGEGTANFALFAGFYVAAQLIERLLEFVSPSLPIARWGPPTPPAPLSDAQKTALAAQIKADRGAWTHGLAVLLGVGASAAFGLFFLAAVGIHTSTTINILATGVIIAAGTKPLHDFISYLQNQSTPTTGTAAGS